MGFRLQQKLMTLNDPVRQFTTLSVISVMRVVTNQLRLESRGFALKWHYSSAICILNLMTKLEGNPSKFQA